MSAADTTIDLIDELRMRRWARENYVAGDARHPDWHAVIVDEMLRRDAELLVEDDTSADWLVPLTPVPFVGDAPHQLLGPHQAAAVHSELHYN
mgnify:CR=1 FL=1